MSDVTMVTGEAVVLTLRPAPIVLRVAAALIDAVIWVLTLYLVLTYLVGPPTDALDPAAAQTAILVTMLGVIVGLPLFWETLSHGRSPGKMMLGIQVMRDDGGAIHFRHAAVRVLTGFLELWMTAGVLALLIAMFNARGKRLGDMAAGTTAVLVRQPARRPELPPVPDQLRPWAQVADIGRLPDGLAQAVTRFLQQSPSMPPAHRTETAGRLAAAVGNHVCPGPPPGTDPGTFLLAVIAERRNRDYRILAARRARSDQAAERLRAATQYR